MRTITLSTNNITAKDKFNAQSSKALREVAGQTIEVAKALLMEDVNEEDGTTQVSGTLITTDGSAYGTISGTVIDQIIPLIDIINEDGSTIELLVDVRKSNAGRDYLQLVMC